MHGTTPADSVQIRAAAQQTAPWWSTLRRKHRRGLLLIAVGLASAAVTAGYGVHWYTTGRFFESTDDAYLSADNVTVAPKVPGYITELLVTDNQPVQRGDILAKIDARDYQTAVESAQADLESAEANAANIDAQLGEQQSVIAQAQATVAADEATVTFAQQELQRYTDLARSAAGTTQRLQQAQSDIGQKLANVQRDTAAFQAAIAHVSVLETQRRQAQGAIERQKALLAQAKINLEQTALYAPVDGVVGDRTVRQGQLVQAGTRLMSVVPTARLYLLANFKETQTGRMVAGQHVTVKIDSFPGKVINGTVDSLAPGTGAQFALLPPENATGNFTKIVQRVPVKILLDTSNPIVAQLRSGLSADVAVDTRKITEPVKEARR